jgi:hypothetical protein
LAKKIPIVRLARSTGAKSKQNDRRPARPQRRRGTWAPEGRRRPQQRRGRRRRRRTWTACGTFFLVSSGEQMDGSSTWNAGTRTWFSTAPWLRLGWLRRMDAEPRRRRRLRHSSAGCGALPPMTASWLRRRLHPWISHPSSPVSSRATKKGE